MEPTDVSGDGACRWLCLEWQELSQLVESCLRYHGYPLERTKVLWSARQDIEWGTIMKVGLARPVRCAIYTRSQAHAGWTLSRTKYDDGGFSGGNTDRPALQRLLEDIRAGKVDVIVVYKVDRLTRSLADFAKLAELFDEHKVSFVSVTQQFNTTTSMGRLTLNVLLSFAQFEREVTSARIRDKIASSKRKGKWSGGRPMLGYDVDPRGQRLSVNAEEAERVRAMFALYLEHESLPTVARELATRGWSSKRWRTRAGKDSGGETFTRVGLRRLLTNVLYAGKVRYRTRSTTASSPPSWIP